MDAKRASIHDADKCLEYWKKRIRESKGMLAENKKLVFEFLDYCASEGLGAHRRGIYAQRLIQLGELFKEGFKDASEQEIRRVVAIIEGMDRAPATKQIMKIALKKFYRWLNGDEELPKKVKWIKTRIKQSEQKLPEDLLTFEEVQHLISETANPRDRAFIACLYESGCRIGEIAGIRIKDVSFDKYGARVQVTGKTGARQVRLIYGINFLEGWLAVHPRRQDPNAFVWFSLTGSHRGELMNYASLRKLIRDAAERAGIKKRVNPHSFRHARSTQLARMGLSESQLDASQGWVQGSGMPKIYLHLSGKDSDDAILSAYGLVEKKDAEVVKLQCVRCKKENALQNKFCVDCGLPLSLNAAVEVEDDNKELRNKVSMILDWIESNPANEKSFRDWRKKKENKIPA